MLIIRLKGLYFFENEDHPLAARSRLFAQSGYPFDQIRFRFGWLPTYF